MSLCNGGGQPPTPPLVQVRVEGAAALVLPSVGLLSPLRSLPLTQVRDSRRMRLELAVALVRPALTGSVALQWRRPPQQRLPWKPAVSQPRRHRRRRWCKCESREWRHSQPRRRECSRRRRRVVGARTTSERAAYCPRTQYSRAAVCKAVRRSSAAASEHEGAAALAVALTKVELRWLLPSVDLPCVRPWLCC